MPTSGRAWANAPACSLTPFSGQDPELSARPEGACLDSDCVFHRELVPWSEPTSPEQARLALNRAMAQRDKGKLVDAVLWLRVAEQAMPNIRDHLASMRAEALLGLGQPMEACRAYALVAASPNRDIAVQGRIGSVRCLLEARARTSEQSLKLLLRRYPRLPEAAELYYKLAQARESWKRTRAAVGLYRSLYINHPDKSVASRALAQLERLRAQGVWVAPFTPGDRVERAERLVNAGLYDAARQELGDLGNPRRLTPPQRSRVHLLNAKMARREGRWDVAREEIRKARSQGVAVPETYKLMPPPAATSSLRDEQRAHSAALAQVRKIRQGRPIRRLRNMQLVALLELSARYGFGELADEILDAMAVRSKLVAAQRFRAAMLVSGLASDEKVARLLQKLVQVPRYRVKARYHRARALERMGSLGEAEAEYLTVVQRDRSKTRYYAMWAQLRLRAIESERQKCCVPELVAAKTKAAPAYEVPSSLAVFPSEAIGTEREPPQVRARRSAQKLQQLVDRHGDAYPWLQRALDLVRLHRFEAAADELSEVYLAWRDATGSPRLRTGMEAVLTGSAPPRRAAGFPLRKARLALGKSARTLLAEVAEMVGEPGVAHRLEGWRRGLRPRAYAWDVEKAAEKHGLDPNLLFAIMRVESIYNREIVSHAGAAGLMQIMPRTGRLIANQLGVKDFAVTDLLDVQTSLDFSAWYMASLLRRFERRLPLAIAAYNGGPHNVRLWLHRSNPNMPLEAFLERIPLSETHRYVRRVLTHYAAYRKQQGLPMVRLSATLPQVQADPMAF